MKRSHVHVAVNDLSKSIAFYSAMFGVFGGAEAEPGAAEQQASCGSGESSAASCCAPAESKAAVPTRTASGCCART
jgi:catechol 2,3-dioxygenase-like lactoylglutathione lyase family enzyme